MVGADNVRESGRSPSSRPNLRHVVQLTASRLASTRVIGQGSDRLGRRHVGGAIQGNHHPERSHVHLSCRRWNACTTMESFQRRWSGPDDDHEPSVLLTELNVPLMLVPRF
jgi:hypothetical protein